MTMPNVLYNGPGNWPDADKLMANYNYLENIAIGNTSFKNRIINGDMRIDQRNAGAAVTVNAGGDIFSVDRWHGIGTAADGAFTLQRVTTVPTGYVNALKATITAADASIGSVQIYGIRQKIEGSNIPDFGMGTSLGKSMTLSFWVQASVTGIYGGTLINSAASRSYAFTYTINTANTYEFKTITVPCDTTGTWLTDTGIGIQLVFAFGTGSTYLGSPWAWAATGYYGATGQTNLIATNAATFYLTGVQLELGTVATPFEFLDIGTELNICRRYYESGGISFRSGNRASGTTQTVPAFYKTTKRAAPTVTIGASPYTTDGWGTYGVGSHNTPAGSNDTLNFTNIDATATSAVGASGVIACTWTSSAEL